MLKKHSLERNWPRESRIKKGGEREREREENHTARIGRDNRKEGKAGAQN